MLFRSSDGKIIDIKINTFITDREYYEFLIKINSTSSFKNGIKNINH